MDTTRSPVTATLRPTLARRVRTAAGLATPSAWSLGVVGVVCLVAGRATGWRELTTVSVMAAVLLAVAWWFTRGRMELEVDVDLAPSRVVAGGRAAVQVTVRNAGAGAVPSLLVELPVGDGVAAFQTGRLAAGAVHEEVFLVPTVRRAVIPVGPVLSVRSDPLGLLRRSQTWSEVLALFVHPRTTAIDQLGTGFVRDLEGSPSTDISNADVAFHSLREYEPGDDRRLIHWLSTARSGTLMVRQFIDTRRSHVAVVVDGRAGAYGHADDFELAVSVAATVGARVLLDEQPLSMVVGAQRIPTGAGSGMLDALAGVDVGGRRAGLLPSTDRLVSMADGLSAAFLLTGGECTTGELRAATTRLAADVKVVAVQVVPGAAPGFRPLGDAMLVTVGDLEDLLTLLWAVDA